MNLYIYRPAKFSTYGRGFFSWKYNRYLNVYEVDGRSWDCSMSPCSPIFILLKKR